MTANKSGLAFQSLISLRNMLSSGEIDANDIQDSILDRIKRLDSKIHAFLALTSEDKLYRLAAASSEVLKEDDVKTAFLLTGIPIAIKDNICVSELPCTAGSKILGNFIPKSDAPIIVQLQEAGAIIEGKTNMHEFAYGVTTNNPHYGATHNPWDLDRIPGGSSGGSVAAVAAGFVPAAIGTDTGGSVRIPAALCGVVGLKPTKGSLNKSGVIPLSWTLDHVGLIARTSQDVVLLFDVLKRGGLARDLNIFGKDDEYRDSKGNNLKGTRVGVPRGMLKQFPLDEQVEKAFEQSLDKLQECGPSIIDIEAPQEWQHVAAAYLVILLSEASEYHEKWVRTSLDAYGLDVRSLVQAGYPLLATQDLKARQACQLITEASYRLFSTVDALAMPSVATVAPKIGEEIVQIAGQYYPVLQGLSLFALLFNLTGQPAMSIPNGSGNYGLPTGLQIVAAHWNENILFKIANAFQSITDFHRRRAQLS
jgi:aspartyl-tRNA(Asn)/glutamyl-tRNA(Gln) amidotransferase subunit A